MQTTAIYSKCVQKNRNATDKAVADSVFRFVY